jgi:hypothetical protein
MKTILVFAIAATACGGTEGPGQLAPPRPLLSCTVVIGADGSCSGASACTCTMGTASALVSFQQPISNATVTRIYTYPVQAAFYQGALQEDSATDYTLSWMRPDGTAAPVAEVASTQWYVEGEL